MQVGLFICSQTQNPPKRVLCLLLQAFTCNSVDLRASLGVTPVSIHQSNLIDSAILLQGKKKSQAFLQVVFVDLIRRDWNQIINVLSNFKGF